MSVALLIGGVLFIWGVLVALILMFIRGASVASAWDDDEA